MDEFSKKIEENQDLDMDDVRRLIWLYEMDCDAIMHMKAFGMHPITGTKYEWGTCEFKDMQYDAILKRNHKNIKILRDCWIKEKMMKG